MRGLFVVLAGLVLGFSGGAFGQSVSTVASNALLKAASASSTPVFRAGFRFAGDGGAATYNYISTTCTVPDDGAEVLPTSGVGCWIADLGSIRPTPMIWGCYGDASSDDTACLQSAFNASAYSTLYNGRFSYCLNPPDPPGGPPNLTGITVAYPIIYVGTGINPVDVNHPTLPNNFGIRQCKQNLRAITITSSSVFFRDLLVTANAGGANSSGATFTVGSATSSVAGNPNGVTFDNVKVDGPCIGFDLAGITLTLNLVQQVNLSGAGCYGMRIGHKTYSAKTEEVRILNSNNTISSTAPPPSAAILIEDVGGLTLSNVDNIGAGTVFCPGQIVVEGTPTGQEVDWAGVIRTEFGDTLNGPALLIDTCASLGVVKGAVINTGWASTSLDSHGVVIRNTGGGTIQGIHFVALRAYNNYGSGVQIQTANASDVSFDGSFMCGNGLAGSNTYANISVAAGVRLFALRGSRVSDRCDGFFTPAGSTAVTNTPILLSGNDSSPPYTNNDLLTIIGNDLSGNALPAIQGTPSNAATSVNVRHNLGVDNAAPTIASAGTITLGYFPLYLLTGTADISTIQGHPYNWTMTLIPTDAPITFLAGSGICHSFTAVRYARVTLSWQASLACWAS